MHPNRHHVSILLFWSCITNELTGIYTTTKLSHPCSSVKKALLKTLRSFHNTVTWTYHIPIPQKYNILNTVEIFGLQNGFFGPFILSNKKDSIVFQLISLRAALSDLHVTANFMLNVTRVRRLRRIVLNHHCSLVSVKVVNFCSSL